MAQTYPPQVIRSANGPPCLPLNQDVYVLKSLQEQVEAILRSPDPNQSRDLLVNLHRNISTLIGTLGSVQASIPPQGPPQVPPQGPSLSHAPIQTTPLDMSRDLVISAIFGNLPRIQALLAAGATNGQVALINATAYGHLPIVQSLVSMNGRPDWPIADVAFFIAAATGNLPIAVYLYPLTSKHLDLLYAAMYRAGGSGYVNVVDFLYNNGANDPRFLTPTLIDAARNGYVSVVQYLVNHGVNSSDVLTQALRVAQSTPTGAPVAAYLQSIIGQLSPSPSPPPSPSVSPSLGGSGSSAGSGSSVELGGSGSVSGSSSPEGLPSIQVTPPSPPPQHNGLSNEMVRGYNRFQQLRQARQFPRGRQERY